ncbi:Ankyrin repeat domain-containing protein 26 [Camelus dromedarius]|uniref:Ankyrin repeat domain-containing protein 26 n=1 Tax=Camelus dromedarius TaxID=9838 RepID=A0A5N4C6N4_CAMDR|nr:Ankyrin repeat domain-containing protein 26 [Camelus dromedarius]
MMKKIFHFGSRKGESPLGSSTSPGRDSRSSGNSPPRYHIRDKDLKKIHKAASVGDVARVQQILLLRKNGLNDRDKMNRTALHLACANGHSAVVTLLVERRCQLNLYDNENRTALMKAIQCQEEACVTILLEHGADPNLTDGSENTALHYAVLAENTSIAAKLLSYNANIEARNKDDLTPLLLAVSENKQQMAEFLVKKEANIHAANKVKRVSLAEDLVDESSEDDSLSRLSNKPDIDDSWPSSDDEDLDFAPKNVQKPSLTKLIYACQQSRKNIEATYDVLRPGTSTFFEDNNSDSKNEDVVGTFPKPSVKVPGCSHPACPSPEPLQKPLKSLAGLGLTKSISESQPLKYVDHLSGAAGQGGDNILKGQIEDVSYIPSCMSGSRNLMMAKLEDPRNVGIPVAHMGMEKNEYFYELLFYKCCAVGVKDSVPSKTGGMKDLQASRSAELDLEMTSEEEKERVDGSENNHSQVEEEKEKHRSSEMEGSGNMCDASEDSGLIQQSKNGKTNNQQFPTVENGDSDRAKAGSSSGGYWQLPPHFPQWGVVDKDEQTELEERGTRPEGAGFGHMAGDRGADSESQSRGRRPRSSSGNGCSSPGLDMKELKKNENEKWTSKASVISPVFEKADSLAGGLLQENDDSSLSEVHQDDGRSAKETSTEKDKVKEQISSVDDLDDLTLSSETASEDCELLFPNYKNTLLLMEQLGLECKDSISFLKIQDAVLSYRRLIELKKNHCELLTGKIKKMENKVSGLQKELSETKELKSQLEHQKVEWEQELCSLRFTLKQEEEKRKNADILYEKTREQLRRKEEQYSEEVEMKQQLEFTLRALEVELRTARNNLNQNQKPNEMCLQVVEELNNTQRQLSREQNARILQDEILTNHLSRQKEIEMANKEMNAEVSHSHEKEKDLLCKNYMLWEEITMLNLERETIKHQNQEKENKYFEDIEIVKEKNDDLQKIIKQDEETLTKTISQYNGQLNVLTAENTMLSSKLENEKQCKERLETEVESYRSRLAAAIHDHEQSQAAKRDLELAFQRARDEWFRLQDKMNFDISNLKDNNEVLSQQLSKAESRLNSLEIELHHTRDALREKTLVLECVQRDLSQAQCQKKEIEHLYQNEQGKVSKYIGKQESLEERLSQLQSENMLLRQQLDDAQNKADSKDKTVINIKDQFQDIVKKLQGESEKQVLMLEERNKELINECNHLKERMYQCENERAEREAFVRQLQQELADTLKKQSMSEASLEVTSRYRTHLEDEAQDLKKKLRQITSQLQEAQDQHAEAMRCAEKKQDLLQKLEMENSKLKVTIKKQAGKIEQLQKNLLSINSSEDEKEQLKKLTELKQSLEYSLDQEMKKNSELEKEITGFKKLLKMTRRKLNEYESGEISFHGDFKTDQIQTDIQINMLKHEIVDLTAKLESASSKYLHLEVENQLLQQELLSMKSMQKKCEKLEKNKKKLEEEVVNLKSHLEMNIVEHSQVEQYKREIEERARQDVVEKLKEVNLFLQMQAASQENLEQLRETNNASIRSQMELRIKDLEAELSKMKTFQEENKAELGKYKQLYLEELKVRKSLANKLNKANERLAEISTKLLVEKQQNKSLLSTLHMRPVLEPPCVGNFSNSLVLNRSLTPRENLMISTSSLRPSDNSMETYLAKMREELEKNITRELEEAAAEFESGSYGALLGSTDDSNLNQDLVLKARQEYVQILKKKYMV